MAMRWTQALLLAGLGLLGLPILLAMLVGCPRAWLSAFLGAGGDKLKLEVRLLVLLLLLRLRRRLPVLLVLLVLLAFLVFLVFLGCRSSSDLLPRLLFIVLIFYSLGGLPQLPQLPIGWHHAPSLAYPLVLCLLLCTVLPLASPSLPGLGQWWLAMLEYVWILMLSAFFWFPSLMSVRVRVCVRRSRSPGVRFLILPVKDY